MIYKLINNRDGVPYAVQTENNGIVLSIPFAPDNTDYQTFKKDLSERASLKDAEGNDMTAEQITALLGELK